jgi:nucleoside-diphosphate-sugar epimerase
MSVLIFGGAGYLGIPLCDSLRNRNRVVTVYDKFLYSNPEDIRNDVTIINDDISNVENHRNIFEHVDIVYYLCSPRLNELNSETQIHIELENLKKVLSLLKPNTKFFFNSSCSVYGKTEDIVNESSETKITSLYSKLKIESENILLNTEGLIVKIFRVATLYGKSKIERNDILINDLVNKIVNNEKIEIFDSEAIRPHLHVLDCAEFISNLINADYNERIINIGINKFNITKRQLIKIIEKTLNIKLDITYYETQDSRSYFVDFSLLKRLNSRNCYNYERGVFDLYFKDKLTFSLEEWDTILNYYRPNGSSRTWYLQEEGKIDIPKMWGHWNIVNTQGNNKMFDVSIAIEQVTPSFYYEYTEFKTKKDLQNKTHIYLINIYDPNFFVRNIDIGFDCISENYKKDIIDERCHIVLQLTMEGYSGCENNYDLEIIEKWIKNSGFNPKCVHYISGNLIIDKVAKEKNLEFNCIPVSTFDNWINYLEIKDKPIVNFEPINNNFLYLTYNRNPRHHRKVFLSRMLEKNLLQYGRISMNKFETDNYNELSDNNPIKRLHDLTPIIIDKSLDINWANDVTTNDYTYTFMSIITESLTDKNTLFLSEKIFKPIATGHPFMVIGNKGTLQKLHEFGFMTFDRWFDESYDMEEEMGVRVDMVINEIEKYKDKTIDELKIIRNQMRDICLHNQARFKQMVRDKYSFDGENINGLKEIQLIIKSIYNKISNGEKTLTFTPKRNII